jgi:phosphohistidine phosphatase
LIDEEGMMILYFLRHELADNRSDWTGDDRKRPLTKEGKERMSRSARTLAALDLKLDAILTSPLTRARQTAEIAAQELELEDRLVEDGRLGPGFGVEAISEIVKEYPKAKALLLVGHEPDFSNTVSALTGGSEIVFKKGGLSRVDLDDMSGLRGQLVWLIPPKVLAGIAA